MRREILMAILFVTCLCSAVADDSTYLVNGVYYQLTSAGAKVVKASEGSYSGDLVIPGTVKIQDADKTVCEIGDNCFATDAHLTSVVLPAGITTLGQNSLGNPGIKGINMYSCTISSGWDDCGLKSCTALNHLELPVGKQEGDVPEEIKYNKGMLVAYSYDGNRYLWKPAKATTYRQIDNMILRNTFGSLSLDSLDSASDLVSAIVPDRVQYMYQTLSVGSVGKSFAKDSNVRFVDFRQCTQLTTFDSEAFSLADNMQTVALPTTQFSGLNLSAAPSLKYVYTDNTTPFSIGTLPATVAGVYVPANTQDAYRNINPSDIRNRIFQINTVTVPAATCTSLIAECDLDFTSTTIKAYIAPVDAVKEDASGRMLHLQRLDIVPKGTPVYIYNKVEKTETIPVASSSAEAPASLLRGSNYLPCDLSRETDKIYAISKSTKDLRITNSPTSKTKEIPPRVVYLPLPQSNDAKPCSLVLEEDLSQTTSVMSVEQATPSTSADGQAYYLNGTPAKDAGGRHKGNGTVIIRNGQKYTTR